MESRLGTILESLVSLAIQGLFFSCPLPKTLWKRKEKHLDFRRYSPHSNKLQMSEEGTYYNKNKTKNKNTGKKENTLLWDWKKEEGQQDAGSNTAPKWSHWLKSASSL